MATLSIKHVPDELAERLRERARRNHRSLQGELLAILEETAGKRTLTIEEVYELNKRLGPVPTTPDSLTILRALRDA